MEKIKNFFGALYMYLKLSLLVVCTIIFIWWILAPNSLMKVIPSYSWWSATLFSDNKVNSIITEVEASGHNIRKVQSIDVFGRVCTDTYSNAGTSTDCDYPPQERREWTIEDYKKLLKANR